MAILQISKIQQRSGNLVDLPQLDDAEFGWATDTKRLFIGKSTPNENIEVLTSYSQINFSQINGSVGNLNISNINIADGQVLSYDGSEWVNRGGDAGGLITLGDVSNVKIGGGAIGYVLETDGLGNLAWTPKSTVTAFFENVTSNVIAVVTTTQDNFFTQAAPITVTNVPGMTQLNGNVYYVDVLTSNTFALYTDSGLSTPVDSTGYGAFPYTTVSATDTLTDQITVANSAPFTVNDPVVFAGDLGSSTIVVGQTYYVKTKPSGTAITISTVAGGNTFDPGTEASPSGARVYVPGGRAVSVVSGGTSSLAAGGSPNQIQYNDTNVLQGNADFTYNNSTKLLTLNGNVNAGNLNATGVSTASRFLSNVPTGTPPLEVISTNRVANLNVAYSNVSDFGVVTTQTTGTFYPVMVSANTSANYALASNANISFNAATGNLSVNLLSVTSNANVGNLGVERVIATGNISAANFIGTGTGSPTINSSGSLSISATSGVTVNNIVSLSTGSNTTSGTFTGNWTLTTGSQLQATTAGTVTTNAQPNITSVGTLSSLSVTGKVTAGQLQGDGGNISNIQGGNVSGAIAFATTANAVAGANVSGQVGNALIAGTVYTAAQPNITSVGTLTDLTVSGNIVAGNISGNIISGSNPIVTTGNANVGNLNTTGIIGGTGATLFANTLTTGGNTIAGAITGNWALTAGSSLTATYADLAEYYEADDIYEPGTVLMFGGSKEVTLADDGTSKVAGVVSTNPAYVMNSTCPGLLTAVALQGRVPCKVRGKISKGDMLISGGNGFARPNQFPSMGTVIGKALQDFDGYEGVIEVAVGRL